MPENIFTCLFYCPLNDNLKTSGLNLYEESGNDNMQIRYKTEDNTRNVYGAWDKLSIPLKKVKTIDFIRNNFIAFAPNKSSWHSVELNKNTEETRNSIQFFFMRKEI